MKKNPLEWLSEALLSVTVIPIIGMMLHVTADVAMKFMFNSPIQGTLETVATYYMVATVVLPIAFIEWTRTPIMVDLFYNMFSRRVQKTVIAFALLLSTVAYAALTFNTLPAAIKAYEIHELVAGPVPFLVWPSRAMLPLTFLIAALVCALHLWRFATSAQAREELSAHDETQNQGVE